MAITQALCTSFKQELLEAIHDFPNDTFKIALYTSAASLDAATTAYTTSNEASGTGYTAGGNTLSVTGPTTSGTAAFVDFADTVWNSATFTARGALIYNSSKANRAVAVLSFGSDRAVSGGNFTVQFPTYDLSNAIVRIV
jgi:hypothetical protein